MMSLRAGAQAFIPPDYKAIEAAVKDKNSAYYYPPLYQRFIANDTTLTADEYKYVYFGNFFVDHPVSEFARDQNALYGIAHLKKKRSHKEADKKKLATLYELQLKSNPFDLDAVINLGYLYHLLGDSINMRIYSYKLRRMADVIVGSGDGRTDSTGYHVLMVGHEYAMLGLFGYQLAGTETQIEGHPCDYMILKSNKDNREGIYFDVSQIFEGYKRNATNSEKRFVDWAGKNLK
jgi:hypothetical protein